MCAPGPRCHRASRPGEVATNRAVRWISSRLALRVPYSAGSRAASRSQWTVRDKLKIIGTQWCGCDRCILPRSICALTRRCGARVSNHCSRAISNSPPLRLVQEFGRLRPNHRLERTPEPGVGDGVEVAIMVQRLGRRNGKPVRHVVKAHRGPAPLLLGEGKRRVENAVPQILRAARIGGAGSWHRSRL